MTPAEIAAVLSAVAVSVADDVVLVRGGVTRHKRGRHFYQALLEGDVRSVVRGMESGH